MSVPRFTVFGEPDDDDADYNYFMQGSHLAWYLSSFYNFQKIITDNNIMSTRHASIGNINTELLPVPVLPNSDAVVTPNVNRIKKKIIIIQYT